MCNFTRREFMGRTFEGRTNPPLKIGLKISHIYQYKALKQILFGAMEGRSNFLKTFCYHMIFRFFVIILTSSTFQTYDFWGQPLLLSLNFLQMKRLIQGAVEAKWLMLELYFSHSILFQFSLKAFIGPKININDTNTRWTPGN